MLDRIRILNVGKESCLGLEIVPTSIRIKLKKHIIRRSLFWLMNRAYCRGTSQGRLIRVYNSCRLIRRVAIGFTSAI